MTYPPGPPGPPPGGPQQGGQSPGGQQHGGPQPDYRRLGDPPPDAHLGWPPPGWQPPPSQPAAPQLGWPQPLPPEPPRKRRGAGLAVVLLVVLALAAVAFTGFVEPGFLKDDPPPRTPPRNVEPAAQAFIGDFLGTLQAGKQPEAAAMLCDNADISAPTVEDAVTGKGRFTVVKKPNPSYGSQTSSYSSDLTGTVAGQQVQDAAITLASTDGGKTWCVETFSFDEPRVPATTVTAQFATVLARVGKGDRGVSALVCRSGERDVQDLAAAVRRKTKLHIDGTIEPPEVRGGKATDMVNLSGRAGRKKVTGTIVIATADAGKTWCVQKFEVITT